MNNLTKTKKKFVYAVSHRVVWVSDTVFQIPVINDLYRVQMVLEADEINENNCTDFVVNFDHKFVLTKLVSTPLPENMKLEIYLIHEKIKAYVKLSEFINYSYSASLPLVFKSEKDKIDLLADSLLARSELDHSEQEKHSQFIETLITEKKKELKKRYIDLLYQIQNAHSLEAIKTVAYKIVYEGLNVV